MSVREKRQRHRMSNFVDMQILATDIRYRLTINTLVLILRATQVNTDLFYLACSLISVVYLPRGYLSRSDSSSVHFSLCLLRSLSLNTLLRRESARVISSISSMRSLSDILRGEYTTQQLWKFVFAFVFRLTRLLAGRRRVQLRQAEIQIFLISEKHIKSRLPLL